ncbi:MAG: aromatic ring-hydroxylating dioxygenase subunit alpha, partial [Pseudomonadota bacterium]
MNVHSQLTHSLEARYYTDPDHFKREKDGLLARTWQFAGHISQLEKPGDYFTVDIADESIICLRDRAGEL